MISVKDLKAWMADKAIGRSASYPEGWISAEALGTLSEKVAAKDPLNYYYRDNPDYPAGHCFTICRCEKCGEYHEAALEHICKRKNSYPESEFK